jgi:hypothetical protein
MLGDVSNAGVPGQVFESPGFDEVLASTRQQYIFYEQAMSLMV